MKTVLALVAFIQIFDHAASHGRLLEPASRSSLWRYDSTAPVNYQDNELYCGGFVHQYQKHQGKCGVCGDSYGAANNGQSPRPNEAGGRYGRGVVVREYKQGQLIDVVVELTKNHRGHFEFRICPTNDPLKRATEECLDTYHIPMADGSGYEFPITTDRDGFYDVRLKLPDDLTCEHCVFRWRYRAGNNWGICEDGVGRLGCGDQEEFRGCADIKISSSLPNPIPTRRPVKPTKRPEPYGGVIPLMPVGGAKVENNRVFKACAPLALTSTPERFKETSIWCEDRCLQPKQHAVCTRLCHCE